MLKRGFDIVVSLTALACLLPLLVAVALMVRIKMGSPVLFLQERPGLNGRPFTLTKFRTMLSKQDDTGRLLADNERLTSFGRFLRSTSLDELPELWNVLRGEMSLVGPRPLLMEYLEFYSTEQARRHEVRPGLTGWAQISGRNSLDWNERFEHDIWYVDNQTILLDLKILFLTVRSVIMREGIAADGEATMRPFTGNGKEK